MVKILLLFDQVNNVYWLWKLFTENINEINSLILLATLIVIVKYTIETQKLRRGNDITIKILQEQLSNEKRKNEPNVILYFDSGTNFYSIVLVLSNEGGSLAKNVKIKIEPRLDLGDNVFQEYFYKNAIFNNGVIIPANNKYIIRVGHTQTASPLYKERKLPQNYKVEVTYFNLLDEMKSAIFDLSVDQFFYRLDPKGKSERENQLESINDNLKAIAAAISQKPLDK